MLVLDEGSSILLAKDQMQTHDTTEWSECEPLLADANRKSG